MRSARSPKPTVELGKVLALFEALDVVMDARVPTRRGHNSDGDLDLDSFLTGYLSDH